MHADFRTRLEQVIDMLGGTSKACASAGVTQPTLDRWKKGTSEPLVSTLSKMAETANVSLDWLVFGVDDEVNSPPKSLPSTTNDDYIYVPFYHVEASAGHGSYIDEHAEPIYNLAFRRRWVEARNFDVKQLVGLIARGDSMEPTIVGNSAIIINKAVREMLDGKVHVIRIGERLWVKRTQWLPNGGLRLISDNKNMYEPMDLTRSDLESENIEVIGEVVHVAHDLD